MIDADEIAVILLAAGRSQRFGETDKLSVPLGGRPLALHAAERAVELGAGRRIAVCSGHGLVAVDLARRGFDVAINPHSERGLASSLAIGIGRAAESDAKAVLVLLADMPFVRTAHLRALLDRFDAKRAPVVASSRAGLPMPPALFDRAHFAALLASSGDEGGRALIRSAALVAAEPDELADIDRPADLP